MCSSGKPKVGTKNFNLSCCITIASNSNVNKILKSIAVIIVRPFLWRFLLIIIFQLCHQFIKCFFTMTFYNVIIILFCDVIFRARVANETYIVLKHPTIIHPPPPWCSSNWFKEEREVLQHNTKQLLYFFLGIQWVDIRKGNDAISPVLLVVSFYLFLCIAYSVCPRYTSTHICCMCFAILESFFTPRLGSCAASI